MQKCMFAVKEMVAAQKDKPSALLSTVDAVIKKLEQHQLAYKARLQPRQVGVHPKNRDGCGLNYEDVHGLGHDIACLGWSWEEVGKAVAVEEEPGSACIEDFNRRLAEGNSKLPAVIPDSLKYGSLSCSHTNMFLRCMASAVESQDEMLSTDGKLDLSKLRSRDANFAAAVEQGLSWTVLSHHVATHCPEFLEMLQTAKNASGHISRKEHEVQVMMKLFAAGTSHMQPDGHVDWASVKKIVLKSKPPCADDIGNLTVFVAACSGGGSGCFLQDLNRFHRGHVNSDLRTVGGQFFVSVADLDVGSEVPWFKIALVKAQYTCPKDAIRDKKCVWLSQGDVNSLKKKVPEVLQAERVLQQCRTLLGGCPVAENTATVALAKLDVNIVRFVLGKQEKSAVKFGSVEEVARVFAQEPPPARTVQYSTVPFVLHPVQCTCHCTTRCVGEQSIGQHAVAGFAWDHERALGVALYSTSRLKDIVKTDPKLKPHFQCLVGDFASAKDEQAWALAFVHRTAPHCSAYVAPMTLYSITVCGTSTFTCLRSFVRRPPRNGVSLSPALSSTTRRAFWRTLWPLSASMVSTSMTWSAQGRRAAFMSWRAPGE